MKLEKITFLKPTLILSLLLLIGNVGCNQQEKEPVHNHTPEGQGISSMAILDFIEAVEEERTDELHSFIIMRHGHNIAEAYWAPYNPESPHRLFSLSKSFTSSAIGMAQQEGLLSIYDPVVSFFPELVPDSISPNLKSMRIKDLLRMNTGHDRDVTGMMQSASSNWAGQFLSLPVEHKPGTHFVYNTAATYMLSAIIQKVTGETLLEYLTPRLFEPLDIINPRWDLSPDSVNVGGWGLQIRTIDIASFGQLYLQKGTWNEVELIPESWIEEATSLQTSNGSNPNSDWEQGYGYQFWRCRNNAYRGDGAFGQYCIVLPEHDAVIAITSGTTDMQAILNLVWEHLLPAFREEPLPENKELQQALQDKIAGLTLSTIKGEKEVPLSESISSNLYTMEPNEVAIQSVVFELTGEEQSIVFNSTDETIVLPIGYQSNRKGEMLFPRYGKQPVTSSGAWITGNHYQVRSYYYETPFFMTFDFIFDGDQVTFEGELNVSFGPSKIIQLKGSKES